MVGYKHIENSKEPGTSATPLNFKGLEHYLGDEGICANPDFESAIVTAIEEKPLIPDEKLLLQPLANRFRILYNFWKGEN